MVRKLCLIWSELPGYIFFRIFFPNSSDDFPLGLPLFFNFGLTVVSMAAQPDFRAQLCILTVQVKARRKAKR